jgi:hypothetical protein
MLVFMYVADFPKIDNFVFKYTFPKDFSSTNQGTSYFV